VSDADDRSSPASTPKLTFNRVVILQWLAAGEQQTGSYIEGVLRSKDCSLPVEVIECESKDDVLKAIKTAASEIEVAGIPILHIESHGASYDDKAAAGLADREEPVAEGILHWDELLPVLAELNIATGFNLVVIAGACMSTDMLYKQRATKPLAFMLFFGFDVKVGPNSLEATLVDFYNALLLQRTSQAEAFEIGYDTTKGKAGFNRVEAITVINRVIQKTVDEVMTGNGQGYHQMRSQAKANRQRTPSPRLFNTIRRNYFRSALNRSLRLMFVTDRFPGILQRLGIDLEARIKEAQAKAITAPVSPKKSRKSKRRR